MIDQPTNKEEIEKTAQGGNPSRIAAVGNLPIETIAQEGMNAADIDLTEFGQTLPDNEI